MWESWLACQDWIAKKVGKSPYEVLFNGDLVEGIHHKSLQVMSADAADQSAAVVDVIGPIASKAVSVYLTKGTECHTRNDECRIGREIGAIKDPSTGHYAWDRLELEFGKTVFTAAHHTSTTSRPYLEASQHSIALGVEIQERARNGKKIPKIIARAHRHIPGVWNDGRGISIITGAWQGLTRHGNKVVPHAVPVPSCAIMDFRDCEPGDLPTIHQKVFIS